MVICHLKGLYPILRLSLHTNLVEHGHAAVQWQCPMPNYALKLRAQQSALRGGSSHLNNWHPACCPPRYLSRAQKLCHVTKHMTYAKGS